MRKAPEAFRTISEAAELLDTPAHVLRFWESRFPQIKPVKRAGGRRYYRPVDIDLLSGIKLLLHDQGMTIRGVQKLLQEKGPRHVAELAPMTDSVGDDVIEADFVPAEYDVLPDDLADDLAEPDLPAPEPAPEVEIAPDPAPTEPSAPIENVAPPAQPESAPEDVALPDPAPNAFADLGSTPAPARPVQRAAPPLAFEPSRAALLLRQGATFTDPGHAAVLNARLQALLARLSAAEARDRARL
jgi:DNA-binding transcriptional MerR regulator